MQKSSKLSFINPSLKVEYVLVIEIHVFFDKFRLLQSAMTYEQAQTIKDDAGMTDEIALSLRRLHSIAAQLREKRMNKGALVLESSEVRFQLDTETHDPLSVINKELRLDKNDSSDRFTSWISSIEKQIGSSKNLCF